MNIICLIRIQKANEIRTEWIEKSVFHIGRSSENEVYINQANVSRVHLKVEINKTSIFITDLKSANGTFVNGQRIKPEISTELAPTDTLKLGQTGDIMMLMSVEKPLVAQASSPQPDKDKDKDKDIEAQLAEEFKARREQAELEFSKWHDEKRKKFQRETEENEKKLDLMMKEAHERSKQLIDAAENRAQKLIKDAQEKVEILQKEAQQSKYISEHANRNLAIVRQFPTTSSNTSPPPPTTEDQNKKAEDQSINMDDFHTQVISTPTEEPRKETENNLSNSNTESHPNQPESSSPVTVKQSNWNLSRLQPEFSKKQKVMIIFGLIISLLSLLFLLIKNPESQLYPYLQKSINWSPHLKKWVEMLTSGNPKDESSLGNTTVTQQISTPHRTPTESSTLSPSWSPSYADNLMHFPLYYEHKLNSKNREEWIKELMRSQIKAAGSWTEEDVILFVSGETQLLQRLQALKEVAIQNSTTENLILKKLRDAENEDIQRLKSSLKKPEHWTQLRSLEKEFLKNK